VKICHLWQVAIRGYMSYLFIALSKPASIMPRLMTILSSLTAAQLHRAADLKDQIAKLEKTLASILGSTSATNSAPGKRKMSAAARAKIAAAQKARWAKAKGKSAAKPAAKKKRTMSAAGRAKIAAAAKARWAKAKAAGKKSL
jgi:CelD/BcsL family acetyltransferase involved in cellulose biosynthesis